MNLDPQVNWLYLDLNSYFASVEEQETPRLQGQPIAVIPVKADSTCCIAASYKAKAFGIQTGTPLAEAKALCPDLKVVVARQDLYVRYHKRIVEAVNQCIPVDRVLSIDEMICKLTGTKRSISEAKLVAETIKQIIRDKVGSFIRCSIGIASNRYLAKLASDMQKPDGLTVLSKEALPNSLYRLSLRDLPGVGEQMELRLRNAGVYSVRQLASLSQERLHVLWGSIEGDRFYHWLRGDELPEPAHHRYSIGHAHVLEPALRTSEKMYAVAKNLVYKASIRLRKEDFWCKGMVLTIQYGAERVLEGKAKFAETRETARLLKILAELWTDVPKELKPLSVSVALHPLVSRRQYIPSLFDDPQSEALGSLVDGINQRFGKDTLYPASLHASLKTTSPRISFSRIPDLSEF